MLFNSQIFIAFFCIVYATYLLLQKSTRVQNVLLLIASYVFYGYWDWRFLSLIALSTLVDYVIGLCLGNLSSANGKNNTQRKALLATSVLVNLGILGFFKYFNFFASSFATLFNLMGIQLDFVTLNIVLPIGISFYTFQTMSYTIEVYRGNQHPTRNLVEFAVFVAFFPQLVAGPIERATSLLPQVQNPRRIRAEMINAGLFLVLWGYFKKVFVADNAGILADQVFNNYTDYQGLDIVIGVLAFAVQIYGDFSGYSDIARGIAKLLGFELTVNFRLPYFALNPSDFWHRWHTSLSSWLRDYLYIPLGGNRGGSLRTYRNLTITMLLGGLWHGASWNFVIWGAFHALILILYRAFERRPIHEDPWDGSNRIVTVIGKMTLMFSLTLMGWLLFRSRTVEQILYMISHVSLLPSPQSLPFLVRFAFYSFPLLLGELHQYWTRDLLALTKIPFSIRIPVYSILLVVIIVYGAHESLEFIYFQF